MTRKSPRSEMSLEKLRSQGLIFTCRELAEELEHNRRGCIE
jgi:hypothetical protein